ncbi:MAG: InlB B-repeat-containing protein, partial [Christensenellales bacterium]
MKQRVKIATVIAVLLTVCIIMCCITACNGDDYTGTYYCYKNGVKQENSWIQLEKNSWADDSGESGRLERKDGYVYCYTEIFGKEETLFWGTISDGVFYWTTGETIPSGDYLIIAYFSDNSDHHNKNSYNSDNDDTGNEDTGNTDNGGTGNEDTGNTDGGTGNEDTGNTDGGDNNQPIDPVVGYMVAFDASGGLFPDGSDVYRIRVAINSTLTEPASPKRAGYEFGGWFCRETNDKWSFSTDRVDGPTFLVARWTETVVDYDVTFHLNYGGGGDVTKKTENGYVTYSPTRDGYQFVGWFTDKQLNNGWNLNTKVTEQGLELYASWLEGEIEVGQLNAPVVSLSNHVFTWNPVPNAKSYRIVLVKGGTTIAEENQSGTFWVLGPEYFSDVAGTYSCTVKIRANGDGINTTNSKYVSKSDTLKIRVLDAITNLTFSNINSTLNWNAVENAEGYEIYFGNTLKETVTEPEFDMSGYDAGEYDVKVVAIRENWASSSKELKVDKQKLKTPVATIDYNVERQEYKIDWSEIRNADCYVLTINGEKITVEESEYTINNDSSDWNNLQDIELTIQAFDSSAEYLISPESEVYMLKKYYKITTATENDGRGNVAVTNGAEAVTLSFDINRYGSDLVVDLQTITADCGMIYPKIDISYGVFTGWYTTAECTNLFDFSKNISNDTKVYAGWVYHSSRIAVYEDAQTAESTAFSIDVAGNKYIYFSTLTDGTYTVVYNNTKNGAVYEVPITLYDAESDDVLHDTVQTSTETVKSFTFVGQAGHVYYLHCGGGSNFATSINLTVYGGERIRDGGKLGGETLLTYYGDEVSVTALNNPGYVFNGWYYEGTKVCGESTYTFSMPAGDVTYIAKWIECPVTLEKNISEAGSVGGLDGAAIGEETTIIATTNNGYTFIGWYDGETKVSDEESLTYTFIMTDEKKTYTAKWTYYTLTTETNMPEAGAYTQKTEEKITVGESVTLTAVPYAGYTFIGWYDGETKVSDGTSLTYTFNMPAESRTYTAKWTYYTLTTETNMPEAGTYTQKIEEKITAGESVTLTVNTNFCYTFIGWYDGDTKVSDGTNLTYTFKMPAENKTLTAKWQIIDE